MRNTLYMWERDHRCENFVKYVEKRPKFERYTSSVKNTRLIFRNHTQYLKYRPHTWKKTGTLDW